MHDGQFTVSRGGAEEEWRGCLKDIVYRSRGQRQCRCPRVWVCGLSCLEDTPCSIWCVFQTHSLLFWNTGASRRAARCPRLLDSNAFQALFFLFHRPRLLYSNAFQALYDQRRLRGFARLGGGVIYRSSDL